MYLGLAFASALLLTLQSLQMVSTQTANLLNEVIPSVPAQGIPDSWKRDDANLTEDGVSGDYYYQSNNQPVTVVTTQYNGDNISADALPQTTLSTTENNETLIQTNPVTENPYLEPSATNGSSVNLTETNTTSPSPGNSTTTTTANTTTTTNTTTTSDPALNITQGTTSLGSGNDTTTSPPQDTSYTSSNFTTTTNQTSVVPLNETSSVSTTNANGGTLDVRDNMNGGLSSDTQLQTKSKAWGAILGIGFGVALIGLVVYVIVKRRNHRDFSHRKLVEEMPGEPVLRLDNGEPLDLKFDGFAYYNPGVQGDNIQMANFPQGHTN